MPKFGTKNGIFSFFAVQGAFLHGSPFLVCKLFRGGSPFLVCELFRGGQRGRQKDISEFTFLDPRGPKIPKFGTKNGNFRVFYHHFWFVICFGVGGKEDNSIF